MSRDPYSGKKRQLLLAFDVGTTFSGISFSILDPGKVPEIEGITKFPGLERAGKDAKIPSVIYYSTDGKVQAVGAEAERDGMDITVEEEGWIRVEWFKLHLDPSIKKKITSDIDLPPLPLQQIGKTALEIFADFLKYLNEVSRKYIGEVHPGIGTSVWESGEIHYILSHPNGWGGPQQSLIRQAAQMAGLVTTRPTDHRKITFVTEGEASLNRCIERGVVANAMISKGEGIVIVDAGGGTIDVSAYACLPDGKTYEEIAEAQCYTKGAIFVTQNYAKKHLEELLGKTQYSESIPQLLETFDRSTKCVFREPGDPSFIPLGFGRKIKDSELGIVAGRLRLEGAVMASFFQPSVQCILDAVSLQREMAHKKISNIFLVGGFSASDYLFNRVKEELEKHGLNVYRPDAQLNKVVSDGAISGILDHPVHTRVIRLAYGTTIVEDYDSSNPEHTQRSNTCFVHKVTGQKMLRGIFDVIIPRNTQVSETQEFRRSYSTDFMARPKGFTEEEILCYEGDLEPSLYRWIDNDPTNFRQKCTVKLGLKKMPKSIHCEPRGRYWNITFDIIMKFGLTELQAQVAWNEGGIEKRGPVEIIYDINP